MSKEILDNEIMSDEELDNVAGGYKLESMADMRAANERGIAGFENMDVLNNKKSDLYKVMLDEKFFNQSLEKLAAVFASHGITMEYKPRGDNIYTYQGSQITREQAWNIIDGK